MRETTVWAVVAVCATVLLIACGFGVYSCSAAERSCREATFKECVAAGRQECAFAAARACDVNGGGAP